LKRFGKNAGKGTSNQVLLNFHRLLKLTPSSARKNGLKKSSNFSNDAFFTTFH